MLSVFGLIIASVFSLLFWMYFFLLTKKHPRIRAIAYTISVVSLIWFLITDFFETLVHIGIIIGVVFVVGILIDGKKRHEKRLKKRGEYNSTKE